MSSKDIEGYVVRSLFIFSANSPVVSKILEPLSVPNVALADPKKVYQASP